MDDTEALEIARDMLKGGFAKSRHAACTLAAKFCFPGTYIPSTRDRLRRKWRNQRI